MNQRVQIYASMIILLCLGFGPIRLFATEYQLETVAEGLDYPWSIAFLPDGGYLVSMRAGELRRIGPDGEIGSPVENSPDAHVSGQGGYFDVALDPEFAHNRILYLAYAAGTRRTNATQVIRAELSGNQLKNSSVIYRAKPAKKGALHYGGRLQFLPDGTLLITTGDGYDYRDAAQDRLNHLGKTIRIHTDGSVPADNPFAQGSNERGERGAPRVFSYGHRNPQGLTHDLKTGRIYLHEHGPRGGDEVNVVEAGVNYGWPEASYGVNYSGTRVSDFQQIAGMRDSIWHWSPSIAPSGITLYRGTAFPKWEGSLFVGALRARHVRRLELDEHDQVASEEVLFADLGERIRDIRTGPDGLLYMLTDSNRGKVVRVRPDLRDVHPVAKK